MSERKEKLQRYVERLVDEALARGETHEQIMVNVSKAIEPPRCRGCGEAEAAHSPMSTCPEFKAPRT